MTDSKGMLSRLPSELRSQIFSECVLNRSIGLLTTCRALYSEFQCHLQKNFVLKLHVIPSLQQSQIWIVREPYQLWGTGRNIIDVASPHLHSDNDYLAMMPLHRFKRIDIIVDAPDPQDPGQIVRLYKEMSALVTMLAPSWRTNCARPLKKDHIAYINGDQWTHLPLIEVELHKSLSSSWTDPEGNSWNQSLPSIHDYNDQNGESLIEPKWGNMDAQFDVEVALFPFLRLRNVQKVQLFIHSGRLPSHARTRLMFKHIQKMVKLEKAYGLHWFYDEDRIRGDYEVHLLESCTFLWLDYLLDDLPGLSAEHLRLERFRTWCLKYEDHFFASLRGVKIVGAPPNFGYDAGAGQIMSETFREVLMSSMNSRYWARHCHTWPHAIAGQPKSRHRHWSAIIGRPMLNPRINGLNVDPSRSESKCYDCCQTEDGVKIRCVGNRGFC